MALKDLSITLRSLGVIEKHIHQLSIYNNHYSRYLIDVIN